MDKRQEIVILKLVSAPKDVVSVYFTEERKMNLGEGPKKFGLRTILLRWRVERTFLMWFGIPALANDQSRSTMVTEPSIARPSR